jgi:hypothetical protein
MEKSQKGKYLPSEHQGIRADPEAKQPGQKEKQKQ